MITSAATIVSNQEQKQQQQLQQQRKLLRSLEYHTEELFRVCALPSYIRSSSTSYLKNLLATCTQKQQEQNTRATSSSLPATPIPILCVAINLIIIKIIKKQPSEQSSAMTVIDSLQSCSDIMTANPSTVVATPIVIFYVLAELQYAISQERWERIDHIQRNSLIQSTFKFFSANPAPSSSTNDFATSMATHVFTQYFLASILSAIGLTQLQINADESSQLLAMKNITSSCKIRQRLVKDPLIIRQYLHTEDKQTAYQIIIFYLKLKQCRAFVELSRFSNAYAIAEAIQTQIDQMLTKPKPTTITEQNKAQLTHLAKKAAQILAESYRQSRLVLFDKREILNEILNTKQQQPIQSTPQQHRTHSQSPRFFRKTSILTQQDNQHTNEQPQQPSLSKTADHFRVASKHAMNLRNDRLKKHSISQLLKSSFRDTSQSEKQLGIPGIATTSPLLEQFISNQKTSGYLDARRSEQPILQLAQQPLLSDRESQQSILKKKKKYITPKMNLQQFQPISVDQLHLQPNQATLDEIYTDRLLSMTMRNISSTGVHAVHENNNVIAQSNKANTSNVPVASSTSNLNLWKKISQFSHKQSQNIDDINNNRSVSTPQHKSQASPISAAATYQTKNQLSNNKPSTFEDASRAQLDMSFSPSRERDPYSPTHMNNFEEASSSNNNYLLPQEQTKVNPRRIKVPQLNLGNTPQNLSVQQPIPSRINNHRFLGAGSASGISSSYCDDETCLQSASLTPVSLQSRGNPMLFLKNGKRNPKKKHSSCSTGRQTSKHKHHVNHRLHLSIENSTSTAIMNSFRTPLSSCSSPDVFFPPSPTATITASVPVAAAAGMKSSRDSYLSINNTHDTHSIHLYPSSNLLTSRPSVSNQRSALQPNQSAQRSRSAVPSNSKHRNNQHSISNNQQHIALHVHYDKDQSQEQSSPPRMINRFQSIDAYSNLQQITNSLKVDSAYSQPKSQSYSPAIRNALSEIKFESLYSSIANQFLNAQQPSNRSRNTQSAKPRLNFKVLFRKPKEEEANQTSQKLSNISIIKEIEQSKIETTESDQQKQAPLHPENSPQRQGDTQLPTKRQRIPSIQQQITEEVNEVSPNSQHSQKHLSNETNPSIASKRKQSLFASIDKKPIPLQKSIVKYQDSIILMEDSNDRQQQQNQQQASPKQQQHQQLNTQQNNSLMNMSHSDMQIVSLANLQLSTVINNMNHNPVAEQSKNNQLSRRRTFLQKIPKSIDAHFHSDRQTHQQQPQQQRIGDSQRKGSSFLNILNIPATPQSKSPYSVARKKEVMFFTQMVAPQHQNQSYLQQQPTASNQQSQQLPYNSSQLSNFQLEMPKNEKKKSPLESIFDLMEEQNRKQEVRDRFFNLISGFMHGIRVNKSVILSYPPIQFNIIVNSSVVRIRLSIRRLNDHSLRNSRELTRNNNPGTRTIATALMIGAKPSDDQAFQRSKTLARGSSYIDVTNQSVLQIKRGVSNDFKQNCSVEEHNDSNDSHTQSIVTAGESRCPVNLNIQFGSMRRLVIPIDFKQALDIFQSEEAILVDQNTRIQTVWPLVSVELTRYMNENHLFNEQDANAEVPPVELHFFEDIESAERKQFSMDFMGCMSKMYSVQSDEHAFKMSQLWTSNNIAVSQSAFNEQPKSVGNELVLSKQQKRKKHLSIQEMNYISALETKAALFMRFSFVRMRKEIGVALEQDLCTQSFLRAQLRPSLYVRQKLLSRFSYALFHPQFKEHMSPISIEEFDKEKLAKKKGNRGTLYQIESVQSKGGTRFLRSIQEILSQIQSNTIPSLLLDELDHAISSKNNSNHDNSFEAECQTLFADQEPIIDQLLNNLSKAPTLVFSFFKKYHGEYFLILVKVSLNSNNKHHHSSPSSADFLASIHSSSSFLITARPFSRHISARQLLSSLEIPLDRILSSKSTTRELLLSGSLTRKSILQLTSYLSPRIVISGIDISDHGARLYKSKLKFSEESLFPEPTPELAQTPLARIIQGRNINGNSYSQNYLNTNNDDDEDEVEDNSNGSNTNINNNARAQRPTHPSFTQLCKPLFDEAYTSQLRTLRMGSAALSLLSLEQQKPWAVTSPQLPRLVNENLPTSNIYETLTFSEKPENFPLLPINVTSTRPISIWQVYLSSINKSMSALILRSPFSPPQFEIVLCDAKCHFKMRFLTLPSKISSILTNYFHDSNRGVSNEIQHAHPKSFFAGSRIIESLLYIDSYSFNGRKVSTRKPKEPLAYDLIISSAISLRNHLRSARPQQLEKYFQKTETQFFRRIGDLGICNCVLDTYIISREAYNPDHAQLFSLHVAPQNSNTKSLKISFCLIDLRNLDVNHVLSTDPFVNINCKTEQTKLIKFLTNRLRIIRGKQGSYLVFDTPKQTKAIEQKGTYSYNSSPRTSKSKGLLKNAILKSSGMLNSIIKRQNSESKRAYYQNKQDRRITFQFSEEEEKNTKFKGMLAKGIAGGSLLQRRVNNAISNFNLSNMSNNPSTTSVVTRSIMRRQTIHLDKTIRSSFSPKKSSNSKNACFTGEEAGDSNECIAQQNKKEERQQEIFMQLKGIMNRFRESERVKGELLRSSSSSSTITTPTVASQRESSVVPVEEEDFLWELRVLRSARDMLFMGRKGEGFLESYLQKSRLIGSFTRKLLNSQEYTVFTVKRDFMLENWFVEIYIPKTQRRLLCTIDKADFNAISVNALKKAVPDKLKFFENAANPTRFNDFLSYVARMYANFATENASKPLESSTKSSKDEVKSPVFTRSTRKAVTYLAPVQEPATNPQSTVVSPLLIKNSILNLQRVLPTNSNNIHNSPLKSNISQPSSPSKLKKLLLSPTKCAPSSTTLNLNNNNHHPSLKDLIQKHRRTLLGDRSLKLIAGFMQSRQNERQQIIDRILGMTSEVDDAFVSRRQQSHRIRGLVRYSEIHLWSELLRSSELRAEEKELQVNLHFSSLRLSVYEMFFHGYISTDSSKEGVISITVDLHQQVFTQRTNKRASTRSSLLAYYFLPFNNIPYTQTTNFSLAVSHLQVDKAQVKMFSVNMRELLNLFIAEGFYRFQTNYMSSKISYSDLKHLAVYLVLKIKNSNQLELMLSNERSLFISNRRIQVKQAFMPHNKPDTHAFHSLKHNDINSLSNRGMHTFERIVHAKLRLVLKISYFFKGITLEISLTQCGSPNHLRKTKSIRFFRQRIPFIKEYLENIELTYNGLERIYHYVKDKIILQFLVQHHLQSNPVKDDDGDDDDDEEEEEVNMLAVHEEDEDDDDDDDNEGPSSGQSNQQSIE